MAPSKAAKKNIRGKVKTMEAKLEWQIPDFYTLCSQVKVGVVVKSPKFATTLGRDIEWYLRLFPGGKRQEFQDFIALYLCNTNTVSMGKIVAKSNFKIKNSKAQVVIDHSMTESDFDCKTAWGIDQLIRKDYILDPANELLTNGSLTIICEIITMPRYLVKELKHNKEVHELQPALASRLELLDIYGGLMDDNIFSDVALLSESRSVRAHKCILARSSSVFATMFDNEMNKEKKEIILEVNDISYDVLLEMIRFIYTGKVNGIEKMIGDLAIAAKKFALHRLLIICEQAMIKSMSIHNVVHSLLVADKVKMKELKATAIEFVTMNGSNVIDQPSFRKLPPKIIFKICSNLAKKFK
ncbi:speckle-type POZ protein-like [Nasonia vitripennis]|uniref:Roadkill n=1 Tax=Nasonia vitripennis TaxID=7425 RepID=A0A7M7H0W8_NASVI|nr:speckle-type POZ protein-like [Nasonia vitripennis]